MTIDLDRAGKRIVATLLASQSILSAGLIVIFTVASITAVRLAGGDESWTGIPSTVLLIGAALVAAPIGRLMDARGRLTGLLIGYGFGISGTALAGWSVITESLYPFLVGIFLIGLGRGAIELGRYAAAEARPPERRARAISLVVMGGTVGSISGPTLIIVAGTVAAWFSLPEEAGPWLLATAFFALAMLMLAALLHPDPREIARRMHDTLSIEQKELSAQPPRGFWTIWADPRMKLAVVAMAAGQLAMVIVMTITPVHMDHVPHPLSSISLVIMAHTLGMFGLSFVTGWLADKVGRQRMILTGGLVLAAACIMAPFSDTVIWLAVALFLLGLGWNFAFVAGSALLDDLLQPSEKGTIQGTVDSIVKIASGIGSFSSGLVFAWTGFALTSWATVVIALLIFGLAVIQSLPRRRVVMGDSTAA